MREKFRLPADGRGFRYPVMVIDLCTREFVGWSMADHARAEPVQDAAD
ncbi:hypothetical protein ACIQK9_19085 [Streptomyces hydrogenans]